MARGKSGRIVLEIDPSLKSDLYEALQEEGLTLKEWFLRHTGSYLAQKAQPSLFNSAQVAEMKIKAKAGKKEK
jgi:hypothetical protein